MKEYTKLEEFYDYCQKIVNKSFINNYSKEEQIKYLRKITDKQTLNSYFIICNISEKASKSIKSTTNTVKISFDNMLKNLITHPEIAYNDYKNISEYINDAEYILKKDNKNLIYFKIKNDIFQIVLKCTNAKNEIYLTTFHKASIKQLKKDINRYIHI